MFSSYGSFPPPRACKDCIFLFWWSWCWLGADFLLYRATWVKRARRDSPCMMCVLCIGGYHECIGGYHECIGGIWWVHREVFSASGGCHDACGGPRWQKPFNLYWKPRCTHDIPSMHHDIPPMYWIPPCTHDIPPMCSWYPPHASWFPPMYWASPHLLMISHRCTHGITQMHHDIPPMYWASPDGNWYSPMYSRYSPMYSWYPPDVLNTHYTGWDCHTALCTTWNLKFLKVFMDSVTTRQGRLLYEIHRRLEQIYRTFTKAHAQKSWCDYNLTWKLYSTVRTHHNETAFWEQAN